jgi:ubiquitin-conjugating enzyme E2 D
MATPVYLRRDTVNGHNH